jgi:hypothetical protein
MVRDAVFDESRRYSAENQPDEEVQMPLPQGLQPTIIEKEAEAILQGLIEQVEDIDSTNDPLGLSPMAGGAEDPQDPAKDVLDVPPPTSGDISKPEGLPEETQDLNCTNGREKDPYAHGSTSRTPPRSPGKVSAADQGVGIQEDGYGEDLTPEIPISIQEESPQAGTDSDEVEDVDQAALDIRNIVDGPRTRRPRRDEDFAYRTTLADDDTTSVSLQAFATGLYAPKPSHREHRDSLPPPPERFKDVWKHPLSDGFSKAKRVELDALQAKETYQEVEVPKDRAIQVLYLSLPDLLIIAKWLVRYTNWDARASDNSNSPNNVLSFQIRIEIRFLQSAFKRWFGSHVWQASQKTLGPEFGTLRL